MIVEEDNKANIDTVQVALRIRPLMPNELDRGCDECLEVISELSQVQIKDLAFTYNHVFPQHITQQEFYDTSAKRLISKLFEGYNVTILAYGQTGSGKTYTMGTNYSGSTGDSTKLGVIPLAVADIFDFVEKNEDKYIFKISVSFMELYQEQCYDLLSGKERSHSILEIREDVNKVVILPGITELSVTSAMETLMVLERGSAGRVTGPTAMNQESSRSHAVFTITIYKECRSDNNKTTTSKFHLVDLAGSERIKKTKAIGERLKEGVKINQGLLALGNVISALGDGTNRKYICYRDSKLTRLLQDSLGGNSLTLMVACVSPADLNLDETVSTLRYADRARRIRNKPRINQDAKAAEIVRLNNLVNELRLQLVGTLPSSSDQNVEKLQEELDREKTKYAELYQKHKQMTEHLGNMLIENTNLCEKALLAEAAKDKIERKLNELTEQCNQIIYTIPKKVDDEESYSKNAAGYIEEIKLKLEDILKMNLKTTEELLDHEIKVSFVKVDPECERIDEDLELNEDQAALEEEKRTIGQVALNQELQELNRDMAIKASVVQSILASNKEMLESHNNLQENEEKILQLEKEKDDLLQELKRSKTKDAVQNEHRNKISILEQEITDLKKKCAQQANVIKTKAINEARIVSLNAELQAMKATKVKIIKRMRQESEQFRKWKCDNERAMLRLRNEDRKRATAMAKMESLHAKQQNVLKRKMEEAISVNKRLKEALDRQKQSQFKRNARGNVKAGSIQQFIDQELELHLSIGEAEKLLYELMEYRALLMAEIENSRCTEQDGNEEKIAKLENDLALRKAQLSDLQQKIVTVDRDDKSRTLCDNIQSLLEAKVALKYLFELLVEAKKDLQNQSEKGYQSRYEEIKEAHDRLAMEYDNTKAEYERQITTVKQQSRQKLSELLALQRGIVYNKTDPCQHLQNKIRCQQERLDQYEEENRKLLDELQELRNANKEANGSKAFKEITKEPKSILDSSDVDSDIEEVGKDPGWKHIPTVKRIKARRPRLTMNFVLDEDTTENIQRPVKRGSDGVPQCKCRGSCSSTICGCVKSALGCSDACCCTLVLCKNRQPPSGSENKENKQSNLSETPVDNQPGTSYFEGSGQFNSTFTRKKRFYFYPEMEE